MDRDLLILLVIVTALIILGLSLMVSPASGALTQQELHLFTKIYDKLTYMLWEDKHQSALQVRNELIQQQILDEEIKQTKLLDHMDCVISGGIHNNIRHCGYPLNVTGVWNP